MTTKPKKAKQDTAVTISEAGQTVRQQIERMKLHYAAREQQSVMQTALLVITAGAEILQSEYSLTQEQTGKWAVETLRAARKQLASIEEARHD